MPPRECPICKKIFTRKSSFDDHINSKKKPCVPPVLENQIIEEYIKTNGIVFKTMNELCSKIILELKEANKLLENKSKYVDNITKEIKLKDNLLKEKDKCLKLLSSKSKVIKTNKTIQNPKIENTSTNNINNIDNSQNNINNTQNNNINNTQNNNMNAPVVLLSFGQENMSYLDNDKEKWKEIIRKGYGSVQALVDEIHFNKKHPENQNVMIPGMKDGFAKTFKANEKKWITKNKIETIEKLYDTKYDLITENYEEVKNDLAKHVKSRFIKFKKDNDNYTKDPVAAKKIDKIKQDIGMKIFDNKDMITNNYKTLTNKKI